VESLTSRKKYILSLWKTEKEKEKPITNSNILLDEEGFTSGHNFTSDVSLEKRRELNKQKLEKWQKEKEAEKAWREV
jgi:post-segregation antitoxin (ccd killing protein)